MTTDETLSPGVDVLAVTDTDSDYVRYQRANLAMIAKAFSGYGVDETRRPSFEEVVEKIFGEQLRALVLEIGPSA